MFTNLFLVSFQQGSQVEGRLKSSTPQLPQLPLLGETMLESMRMYGWEIDASWCLGNGASLLLQVLLLGLEPCTFVVALLPIWIPRWGG